MLTFVCQEQISNFVQFAESKKFLKKVLTLDLIYGIIIVKLRRGLKSLSHPNFMGHLPQVKIDIFIGGTNHDSKGITFSRSRQIGKEEITITLNWKKIAKRISELVATNRYLNDEEMEGYPAFLQKQMEQQLEYERKMLNHEPAGMVVENSSDENVKKDYRWKVGDTFYKGMDEYTIIEDGNEVAIQSDEFPLFIDYLSREDFKNLLKENPLNDK